MPEWNFNECMSGDLKFVSKSKYFDDEKCAKHWEIIFNEYLAEFGLPPHYLRYLEKMKKAIKLYDQSYNNNERWKLIKARIAEEEASKELIFDGESLSKTAARVSKFLGFQIDLKKVPVVQFHNYINLMNDGR